MRPLLLFALIAQVLLVAGGARADAYEDGLTAYAGRNYAAALRIWAPIAEQGDARAQNSLGILYQNGQGIARDESLAAKWYLRAALQGSPDAQFNVGLMYEAGRGVERDLPRAYMFLDLSATAGMGRMNWNGIDAINARNRVATRMAPELVAQAQQKAKRCRESQYWECD